MTREQKLDALCLRIFVRQVFNQITLTLYSLSLFSVKFRDRLRLMTGSYRLPNYRRGCHGKFFP